ncbi:MAG TPA: mechanosensitive ion channel, partial [Prolixibacteraceae bacterium]|nr:mechanosensitive ion channel [Prolixibacteraceae bacterium]
QKEIDDFNAQLNVPPDQHFNGRRQTNLGIFRKYLEAYLRNHKMINQEMTFLVRHLQPTDKGIPIEIYVFCTDKRWAHYEAVQADIFDHILAVIPEFDLSVYQAPSGRDLSQIGKH